MTTEDSIIKTCTKCKVVKPFTEFWKEKLGRYGLMSQCKLCRNAVNAAYYAENSGKNRARSEEWRKSNPEKVRENRVSWRSANIEKVRADGAAYRARNQEKNKARCAKWYMENPEKKRIYDHNRRARKKNNGGKLSSDLTSRLYKLQRGKCPCCNLPLCENYHLDHIMPLALGGTNIDNNMQLLRQHCNNQKAAKHPIEFMQQRGFLL